MKIMVTGGAGYIGSAVVPELIKLNHTVKVIDLEKNSNKDVNSVVGDIRDLRFMDKQLNGIDAVIHLAAVVPPSPLEPELEGINIIGTKNFINFCKEKGVKNIYFSSSTSVYGNGINLDETAIPKVGETAHAPNTLYASGKIIIEDVMKESETKDFHPTIFRFATVFGKSTKVSWQSLFNSFVKEAFENNELVIKHPNAYRPLCHVKDIAKGIVTIIQLDDTKKSGQIFNIGGYNLTKLDIVKLIKDRMPNVTIKDLGGNDIGYSVNFNKIKSLGYNVSYTCDEGVKELLSVLL